MARKPLEDAQRFDYRVGNQGYTLGGIMKDVDPGSTPPNRPRAVLNGRYQGGSIISRPPYTYVDFLDSLSQMLGGVGSEYTVTLDFNGKFIAEHHPTRLNNQLWVGRWDGNSSYLQVIDQPFKIPEDIASYPSLIQKPPVVERFNGEIFVGDTGYLRRIYRVGLAIADLPTDDILYTFPGFRAYAMHEYNGRIFVFVADPTSVANSYVFSYDGQTVFAEVTGGTAGKDGASFQEFNGKLFLGIKGESFLRIRDAAGSWSTQAATGGAFSFAHSGFANAMYGANDALYIAGDDRTCIYSELGGVPSLVCNAADGSDALVRHLVGCSIGSYAFHGKTVKRAGDTYYTPQFNSNPTRMATENSSTDIIPKACAIFANRLYFAIGYDDTSVGGSVVGFFSVPRSVLGLVGGFPQAGVGVDSSIESMKGDVKG